MSDILCPLLYSGIATSPYGGYRPCCRFLPSESFRGSIDDYKSSKMYKDMEQDFLSGKWPKGCHNCEVNEKRNGESKRLKAVESYKSRYNHDMDLVHLQSLSYDLIDLRLSNRCNLGCLTCNPRSSSMLFNEVNNNYGSHMQNSTQVYNEVKDINLLTPYSDKEIDKLFETVNNQSRVYFTGGEPFIIQGVMRFLQRLIDAGYNEFVWLEFNSNFQLHNPKLVDLLSYFPNGSMMPSVDATGKQAEYIRYPSNWELVDKNIKLFAERFPDWKIELTPTISLLNIFYLDELIDYCKINGYKCSFRNILFMPSYFNITTMPDKWKEFVIDKLGHIPSIKNYIFSKDSDLVRLKQCRDNLRRIDNIRSNSFEKSLPILKEMFDQCL